MRISEEGSPLVGGRRSRRDSSPLRERANVEHAGTG